MTDEQAIGYAIFGSWVSVALFWLFSDWFRARWAAWRRIAGKWGR